ncbi:MAG: RNA-binding S4 domain-containing protein [Synergistaceae bacterium]|jgi:ribosomal 50S subunit-recycling heat shock protein|nr:RNA-binding S4 domain-containing protein [Synergistaceae bacterium]
MRIDKFLKLSRLVKRRAVACEMVDVGAVRLNGRKVKPSAEVRDSDVIEVAYPKRIIRAEVITADERTIKRGGASVRVTEDRRLAEDEIPW